MRSGGAASATAALLRLQPDARLVALVREGHGRAFDEIGRRYRSALVRFACAFVPHARAEDVVQEALLRAYHALRDSDSEVMLRPWLYRIVRNGAISELRAMRPHEQLDDQLDGVPQPPDVLERKDRLRDLVAAIGGLPAAQRDALVRSELEGSSHDEIARALDTTEGGVRQLIFRARTTLRTGLGLLLPMPVLRVLLSLGETPAGGLTAGGVATGTATAAGGGPIKIGATIAATLVVIGSGAGIGPGPDNPGQAAGGQSASADHAAAIAGVSAADPLSAAVAAKSDPDSAAGQSSAADTGDSGASHGGDAQGGSSAGSAGGSGGGGAPPSPPQASSPPSPAPPPTGAGGQPPGGGPTAGGSHDAYAPASASDCPPPNGGSQQTSSATPQTPPPPTGGPGGGIPGSGPGHLH